MTLPSDSLRLDDGPYWPLPSGLVETTFVRGGGSTTRANLGLAIGFSDDFELGAHLIKLQLDPVRDFADPSVYALYRLLGKDFELGIYGELTVPFERGMTLTAGLPLAFHLGDSVRIDTGPFILHDLQRGPGIGPGNDPSFVPGNDPDLVVPLQIPISFSQVTLGPEAALVWRDFDNDDFILGFFAGYTLESRGGTLGDLGGRLRMPSTNVGTDVLTVMFEQISTSICEDAMELADRVVVVTGGASGIGRALCRRFAAEGARRVVVADVSAEGAASVATEIGAVAVAVTTDVGQEADVRRSVASTLDDCGAIDLFCSNAGIAIEGGIEGPDDGLFFSIDVNFMAHLWAARALMPSMLARGEGYLLSTASAAGLLTQIGSVPYTVSKHMAVALAEWLSVTYGDRGIRVSVLCPQGVRTGMLNETSGPRFLLDAAIEPEIVANHVIEGLAAERFLILPHPEVREFVQRKATDPDRWLAGMRRLAKRIAEA